MLKKCNMDATPAGGRDKLAILFTRGTGGRPAETAHGTFDALVWDSTNSALRLEVPMVFLFFL